MWSTWTHVEKESRVGACALEVEALSLLSAQRSLVPFIALLFGIFFVPDFRPSRPWFVLRQSRLFQRPNRFIPFR